MIDAGDEKQVRKARDRDQQWADQVAADWEWLLSHRQGRRVVWQLLDECGVFRSSFTGNSTTFYNEGMRNIGLAILSRTMDARPEAYAEMLTEQREREAQWERELAKDAARGELPD